MQSITDVHSSQVRHNGKALRGSASINRLASAENTIKIRQTHLFLPSKDDCNTIGKCSEENETKPELVSLPQEKLGVDEYFQDVLPIFDSSTKLLSSKTIELNESTKDRVLYVAQREIAHCTATQCDILVSDRATTCHILAFRSTSSQTSEALCTVAHIDSCRYDHCIRKAIDHHKKYHRSRSSEKIQMDLHVLGGFLDDDNSSRKISNWLFNLLADLASEMYSDCIMVLKTAAISCINNTQEDGMDSPIGRGLALECKTGHVFLAKCNQAVMGPVYILRHARLYSNNPTLLELCDESMDGNIIQIQPFRYRPYPYLDELIQLPDEQMIQSTSTSPHCEGDDFCSTVRQTVNLLRSIPYQQVFGRRCDQVLEFQRCESPCNSWQIVQ